MGNILIFLLILGGIVSSVGVYLAYKNKITSILCSILFFSPVLSIALLKKYIENPLIDFATTVGYFFLGFIAYFSPIMLLLLIVRKFAKNVNFSKLTTVALCFTVSVLAYGFCNTLNIDVKRLKIADNGIKVCFVSDVHAGSIHTVELLKKLPKMINEENVDLVIFGGDLIDSKALVKYRDQFVKYMKLIKSKYGIYGVLGNHEYYCGRKNCIKLLGKAGIKLLLDSHEIIDNKICLLGRVDVYDQKRKDIKDIIPDTDLPILLIDHNPIDVYEAATFRQIIMQLSGHTHAGQMFPNNIMTNRIFGNKSCELLTISDMKVYITSGYGFWGLPYRIGNNPEIVIVEL